jgi:hypothetical protein
VRRCQKIRSLNTSGQAFWKNRIFNCASKNPESDSEKLVVPEGTSVPTEEGS